MTGRLDIAVGILLDAAARRVLIAQRPRGAMHEGLWEFPGGKQAPGESGYSALQRELAEELGIRVERAVPFMTIDHDYPQRAVRLHVWRVQHWQGTPGGNEGQPVQWIPVEELRSLAFPEADRAILNALSLPPLCAITPDLPDYPDAFFVTLDALLSSGLRLLQFRSRRLSPDAREQVLGRLLKACSPQRCLLLVNGTPEEALRCGADGVHLSSAALRALDRRPASRLLFGASCHDEIELQHARRLRADFTVLGPVRHPHSHEAGSPLGWDRFSKLASAIDIPSYALGGLEAADLPNALQRGAQGIAMIGGIWSAPDPAAAVRACVSRPLSAG